jgi:hypothetical protein
MALLPDSIFYLSIICTICFSPSPSTQTAPVAVHFLLLCRCLVLLGGSLIQNVRFVRVKMGRSALVDIGKSIAVIYATLYKFAGICRSARSYSRSLPRLTPCAWLTSALTLQNNISALGKQVCCRQPPAYSQCYPLYASGHWYNLTPTVHTMKTPSGASRADCDSWPTGRTSTRVTDHCYTLARRATAGCTVRVSNSYSYLVSPHVESRTRTCLCLGCRYDAMLIGVTAKSPTSRRRTRTRRHIADQAQVPLRHNRQIARYLPL